jgi:hypothetical protein
MPVTRPGSYFYKHRNMKRFYLLLLVAFTSTAAFSQQLPSQVQAKRGVFTERLYLRDRWIDKISTDLNTADSSTDGVLATGKAIADFIKLHSGKNLATSALTAESNYTHNWNHKQLYIDSIKTLRFFSSENDVYLSPQKTTFTFSTSNNIFNAPLKLQTALRNSANTADSIQYGLSTTYGATQLAASEAISGNPLTSLVQAAAVGGITRATILSEQGTTASTIVVMPNQIAIAANDSIDISGAAIAATADSVYVPGPFKNETLSNRLYKTSVANLLSSGFSFGDGLTKTGNTIKLGGVLNQPVGFSSSAPNNTISIRGWSGISNPALLDVVTNGILGTAIQGEGAQYGVVGKSSIGAGIYGTSASGYGIYGSVQPASGNTVVPVLALDRSTADVPANGIGLTIDLYNQTSTSNQISTQLFSKWRDVANESRTSVFGITGTSNAITDTLFELDGTGKVRLKKYTTGTFTSTDTTLFKPAAFDAQGNLYRMQNWPKAAAGSTATFDQVLTAGNTLSGDKYININNRIFSIRNGVGSSLLYLDPGGDYIFGDFDNVRKGVGLYMGNKTNSGYVQLGTPFASGGNSSYIQLDAVKKDFLFWANYDTRFHLFSDGRLQLPQYGADTIKGTPATGAAFDANGNLIEKTLPQHFAQTSTVSVSGTNNETSLIGTGDGNLTIPASAWRPGKTYRVTISGRYTTDVNNPTSLRVNLKLGSVTIAAKNTFVGANRNDQFRIVCEFACRSTGSTGTIMAFGNMWNADNVNDFSNGTTASVIDMTTAQILNITTQLSDASAGNSVSAYMVNLEEIN